MVIGQKCILKLFAPFFSDGVSYVFFLFSLLGKLFEGNVRNQIFPIWNLNFRKISVKTRCAKRSAKFWGKIRVLLSLKFHQILSDFISIWHFFYSFFFTLRGLNFLDTNPLQVLPDGTKNDRTFKFELFCVTNKKITNILTEKKSDTRMSWQEWTSYWHAIRFAALNYNLKRDKNEPISWVVIRFNLSK